MGMSRTLFGVFGESYKILTVIIVIGFSDVNDFVFCIHVVCCQRLEFTNPNTRIISIMKAA
jgi:purine-cytosine permease-like protein